MSARVLELRSSGEKVAPGVSWGLTRENAEGPAGPKEFTRVLSLLRSFDCLCDSYPALTHGATFWPLLRSSEQAGCLSIECVFHVSASQFEKQILQARPSEPRVS